MGFPGGARGKGLACQHRKHKRRGFDPWVGKIPWRRAWQPTPVILLAEPHGERTLAGYTPQGQKELDTTEVTDLASASLSPGNFEMQNLQIYPELPNQKLHFYKVPGDSWAHQDWEGWSPWSGSPVGALAHWGPASSGLPAIHQQRRTLSLSLITPFPRAFVGNTDRMFVCPKIHMLKL